MDEGSKSKDRGLGGENGHMIVPIRDELMIFKVERDLREREKPEVSLMTKF